MTLCILTLPDFEFCYNWKEDSYLIVGKGFRLDILASRLNAFGIYPRNEEITSDYLYYIVKHIHDYEQRYMTSESSIKRRDCKKYEF